MLEAGGSTAQIFSKCSAAFAQSRRPRDESGASSRVQFEGTEGKPNSKRSDSKTLDRRKQNGFMLFDNFIAFSLFY